MISSIFINNKTTIREVEVAIVWLYRSTTEKWETKQLDMPNDPEKGLVEFQWTTNIVISFRGFICWVDYHHGIIYSDVFAPELELCFHPLPGIEMWRGERQCPTMYRTVSICRGHLKFVDVDNGLFRSSEGDNDGYRGSGNNYCCSIKVWILKMPEFEWEEDATLELEDLWSLSSLELPRFTSATGCTNFPDDQPARNQHSLLCNEWAWILRQGLDSYS